MGRRLRLLDTNFKKRGVGNNRFLNDPRKALMILYTLKYIKLQLWIKLFQCQD